MEYHWERAHKYQLSPLDSIQRRTVGIVDDPKLTDDLEPLSLRGDVCILPSIFEWGVF